MSASVPATTLAALPVGTPARISGEGREPGLSERLADLGFVPDTPVEVVRIAPLGDPLEVEIRGFRLCLRRRDAERLLVTRERERP